METEGNTQLIIESKRITALKGLNNGLRNSEEDLLRRSFAKIIDLNLIITIGNKKIIGLMEELQ